MPCVRLGRRRLSVVPRLGEGRGDVGCRKADSAGAAVGGKQSSGQRHWAQLAVRGRLGWELGEERYWRRRGDGAAGWWEATSAMGGAGFGDGSADA